jgi:RimJ/RimL family protein N-acetyltransferase
VKVPYTFEAPIKTERLVLRLFTEADVDDVHSYQSREDVCRYLLFEPRTRDEVAERLARHATAITLAADGDYWQIAMELPGVEAAASRVIGDIYLTIKSVVNQTFEIGWSMHPDFYGHGYATEAASAILALAFEAMEGHRVVADLDPRNDASIALCKRLGMREEAHFVKDLWFRGAWADTGVYAILDTEYAAR